MTRTFAITIGALALAIGAFAQAPATPAANPFDHNPRSGTSQPARRGHGDRMEAGLHHMTVALPGATAATTGLPVTAAAGGAWLMDAGTSAAHIMVPGE